MEVVKPDVQDVSPPLSELAKLPVPEVVELHEAEPARAIPHMRTQSAAPVHDPVVQTAIGGPNIPTTTVNFEGMGSGLAGFTVVSAPPDTDGDIGPNHYVQIVNTSFTIFSRTGTKLLGPMNTNTLFIGFGGACETTGDGDGVVRYDRIADRWVIAQFSVSGGPFLQCIAVSTSPDPTGSYSRYQFSYTAFNDYPKMGLWPDGYYTTFNIFTGSTFSGAKVCAYDRAKMLISGAATQQCFDAGAAFGGLLASDLDGPTLPPAGSPNFIGAINATAIDFWKMHVDFTTPANSTFVGPTTISVAAYSPLCGGGTCVVQPGTTQKLDSLADRAMNRFVYRNYGDHEALLMSHSVTAGAGGGVRFYELRSPATTPTIFQQGTYAPDAAFRWMPSMAFDKDGNIAMGFSTSSSTINPSIRYTGRLVADPLGTMGQGEATLVAGTGSQTGSNLSRWGDYSSLNIDPTDDCTFWYTQEYIGTSGAFNWRTRIGAFKFPTCGSDFSITPSPTSRTVAPGQTTTYAINTAVLSGAAQNINLTVSGLPAGVTGSFSPTSVTAGNSSTLTLTVAATAVAGTTQFTITGMVTSATHTVNASVTVTMNVLPMVSITAPANNSTVSGTAVPVTATATDSDGSVMSVRFDLPDGTSVTDTTAPFSTTFDSTKVADGGGYVIRATATDNLGATNTSTVTVTVHNINQVPTVAITAPANNSTVSGTAVPVTATATDPDGTVANVKFDLPDGTSVTDTTAPYSTTFDSTKVADGGGYMITATATDNQGATKSSTVTVTVHNINQAPTVAVTAPANGATVSGTAVPVTATATDPDGSVTNVKFDLPDGTSVTDTTAPYSTTFDSTKVPDGGGYMITATATDNQGATKSSTVTVTVHNNQPPTVAITAPANGATVIGTAVPVTATATDSDGSVMSVKFDLPDGTSVTDTTAPFSTTFDSTKVANGSGYMITATATDNQGATKSSTVTVTVANNPVPCVNGTFSAQDAPIAIRDNDPLGITSSLPVTCTGTIKSLSLSLNITHPYRGDLVVTLISPGGTQFSVSNRAGGAADDIIFAGMAITTFNGQTANGSWKLQIQDLAPADAGTLNSWSMTITSN